MTTSASRLSCMDGASDDNALGLSALSARGAVFPAEPEGDDAREAAFTDDSAGTPT